MKALSVTAVVLVAGVASFTAPAMGELVGNVRGGDHKAHAPRLSRAVVSPSESPTASARGGSVEVRAESSEAVEPAAAGGSTVAPLAPSTFLELHEWAALVAVAGGEAETWARRAVCETHVATEFHGYDLDGDEIAGAYSVKVKYHGFPPAGLEAQTQHAISIEQNAAAMGLPDPWLAVADGCEWWN